MRAILLATLALAALTLPVPPAAALSTCGGNWVGSATCFFQCDTITVIFRGIAFSEEDPAVVRVVAECGVFNANGAFTPLFTYSCTDSGPSPAQCSGSGNTIPGLIGRCRVSGIQHGAYSCSSI